MNTFSATLNGKNYTNRKEFLNAIRALKNNQITELSVHERSETTDMNENLKYNGAAQHRVTSPAANKNNNCKCCCEREFPTKEEFVQLAQSLFPGVDAEIIYEYVNKLNNAFPTEAAAKPRENRANPRLTPEEIDKRQAQYVEHDYHSLIRMLVFTDLETIVFTADQKKNNLILTEISRTSRTALKRVGEIKNFNPKAVKLFTDIVNRELAAAKNLVERTDIEKALAEVAERMNRLETLTANASSLGVVLGPDCANKYNALRKEYRELQSGTKGETLIASNKLYRLMVKHYQYIVNFINNNH